MPSSRGLSVEMDGMQETIGAVRALDKDLRKQANAELRAAAKQCAAVLAAQLVQAANSCGVPVAHHVAAGIKVKSDRLPVVSIGAGKLPNGGRVGAVLWGSEQGPKSDPNHFAVSQNLAGYWIAPTTAAFQGNQAVEIYKRGVYETMHSHGLV